MIVDAGEVRVNGSVTGYDATFIKPDYEFTFGLEGGYHWGTGNDLTVSWMHYDKSFEDRGEYEFGSYNSDLNNSVFINQAKFEFDAVNAEFGQHIDVGPSWDLRAHIGGQYMKLNRELNYKETDNQTLLDAGDNFLFSDLSDFKGIGPRAGFDAAYNLTDCFALVGKTAVSLLFGELKGSRLEDTITGNVASSSPDVYNRGETNAMVVGLDGKLGLRYTYGMSNGTFSIEGGYAGSAYINSIVGSSIVDQQVEETSAYFAIGSAYVTLKYVS